MTRRAEQVLFAGLAALTIPAMLAGVTAVAALLVGFVVAAAVTR